MALLLYMKKINESFICIGCQKLIPEAKKTCRNHCPFCFTSLHVDGNMPGDRTALESCGGRMYPRVYEIKNSMTKIQFQCTKCTKTHWNKASDDDNLGELDMYIEKYKSMFDSSA